MIRIFDLETTGLDPQRHRVVEIAAYDLTLPARSITPVGAYLCKPGQAIPPEASAVHHIVDSDVENAHQFAVIWAAYFATAPVPFYCAHNSEFEQRFIPTPAGTRWICTYKCALRVWPDAPGHSNQILRYWRGIDRRQGFDREQARLAHRAAPDAYVTAWLLDELLEAVDDIELLVKWSAEPKRFPVLSFGKHRGSNWADVPADYLGWLCDGDHKLEIDWRFGARIELARRAKAGVPLRAGSA